MQYIVTAATGFCQRAFRAIKHGYADAVITGNSEAPGMPLSIANFADMTALTTSADR